MHTHIPATKETDETHQERVMTAEWACPAPASAAEAALCKQAGSSHTKLTPGRKVVPLQYMADRFSRLSISNFSREDNLNKSQKLASLSSCTVVTFRVGRNMTLEGGSFPEAFQK